MSPHRDQTAVRMTATRFYARFRLGLLVALVILLATPSDARPVTLALLAALFVVIWFFGALSLQSRALPIGEIGVWFVGAVAAYTLIPLAIYLALGQQYTLLNDNRLLVIHP